MHATHITRTAGRTFGRRRFYAARHHGRWERRVRVGLSRRGFVVAHRGWHHYGRRFAASRRMIQQDQAIQQAVGPASAYQTVSTSGGTQVGAASYYSGRNHTASGGFVGAATCAHRSLPFGTRVLVTNLSNSRQAVLTVNDRGPFVRGRIVDVSRGAAGTLGMIGAGVARVSLRVIGGPG